MNQKPLTKIQEQLLELLKKSDRLLTIREMQSSLDVSSTSVIVRHISNLEKKGYLKRNPHNPRDFQILSDGSEKEIAWLNLYGLARCGRNGMFLDGEVVDRIPIAAKLLSFPSFEGFLVKAQGDSMAPRINEGDFVIGRISESIESGKVVICQNNGEVLIKKIQIDKDSIILFSLNTSYPPFIASDDFRVIGEVKGIISR
ncbi:MAG TPA: S24 family peptidase [Chlamydiales bacterium]|nr:S24 family peptidase [Chlamydiales bacterium]